jgi:hypothetical protein
MNRSNGFVGLGPHVVVQELGETGFVKITHRAFTIRFNPFRMLRPKIVMNLKLERGKGIDRMRPDNWHGQGCSCAKHDSLDNRIGKIVQIKVLWDTIAAEIT